MIEAIDNYVGFEFDTEISRLLDVSVLSALDALKSINIAKHKKVVDKVIDTLTMQQLVAVKSLKNTDKYKSKYSTVNNNNGRSKSMMHANKCKPKSGSVYKSNNTSKPMMHANKCKPKSGSVYKSNNTSKPMMHAKICKSKSIRVNSNNKVLPSITDRSNVTSGYGLYENDETTIHNDVGITNITIGKNDSLLGILEDCKNMDISIEDSQSFIKEDEINVISKDIVSMIQGDNWKKGILEYYQKQKEKHPAIAKVFVYILLSVLSGIIGNSAYATFSSTIDIKASPETHSTIVEVLHDFQYLKITDDKPYYYQVIYTDENGTEQTGWVAKKNIEVLQFLNLNDD